jgi:hypothetical protein
MPDQGSYIGILIKPYGYRGDMFLKGNPGNLMELKVGIPLFIEKDGQRIPFFIEEIMHEPSSEKCTIKLEFINSDIEARKYMHCKVHKEYKRVSKGKRSGEDIAGYHGYKVIDSSSGIEFIVADYFDNPGNPIFLLKWEGDEVMLPGNADYILSFDHDEKIILAAFPEGLLG